MRDRLILEIWRLATAVGLLLAWRPRRPPPREARLWAVGEGETVGWVVFIRTASWATGWHVWVLRADDRGGMWLIDPNDAEVDIAPIGVSASRGAEFALRTGAEHVVEIRGTRGRTAFVATPVSCATLAQAVVGLRLPGALTPERLLDELWRRRHVEGKEGSEAGSAERGAERAVGESHRHH